MVFIVVLVLGFLLQLVLPWWVVIVISFGTAGLIGKTAKISFWQPFIAILLLWAGVALYKSIPNHHLLSERVAQLFGLKYWIAILIVTAFLGGLVAGISGYCGHHFRRAIIAMKAKN